MAEKSKRLFTSDHAEMLKVRAGQPYRPSNGMEGELFDGLWCQGCVNGEECPIFSRSYFHEIGHPDYPPELQYGCDGQPICTKFIQREQKQ